VCCLLERGCYDSIGTFCPQRKVTGALIRILNQGCQAPVKRSPAGGPGRVIQRRGEQRVGESDVVAGDFHHAGSYGGLHTGWNAGRWSYYALEQPDGRIRHRCGDEEQFPDIGREVAQPLTHELLKRARHGETLARFRLDLAPQDSSRDLQGEKRIAPRRPGDLSQYRARKSRAEPGPEQLVKEDGRQGRQAQPMGFLARKAVGQQHRDAPLPRRPQRRKKPDPLGFESAEDELEHACRRPVHPMEVIDCHEDTRAFR
jgi:hypothetical protein